MVRNEKSKIEKKNSLVMRTLTAWSSMVLAAVSN